MNAFHERLRERFEAIAGVTDVAAIDQPPLTGPGNNGALNVIERPLPPGQTGPPGRAADRERELLRCDARAVRPRKRLCGNG